MNNIQNNFFFPFTHWLWTFNWWLNHKVAWETEWQLVRFWDHVYRFKIDEFAAGLRLDVVIHFSTDKGKSLDPAICLQPAVFMQPFIFDIEHEMALLNCETTILKGYDSMDPKNFLGLGPNLIDGCSLSSSETVSIW